MQMYKVAYQSNFANEIIKGEALVCASSLEQAGELVLLNIDLPPSCTTYKAERIKPSFYQLSRHEVRKPRPGQAKLGEVAAAQPEKLSDYDVTIKVRVRAIDESHALRRTSNVFYGRLMKREVSDGRYTKNWVVECKEPPITQHGINPMSQVELYQPRNV